MAARFRVEFSREAVRELESLRAYDQRRIADEIALKLTVDANVETQGRKCLGGEPANFSYTWPLWELKVGEFRVFYEVDADEELAFVHAVRRKPPHKTTAEVLNEADGG